MPLNLLTDAWIPVRRASGACVIRPAQITENISDDPVLAPDWPRADFRIALLEFLIGLLATACPPIHAEEWIDGWEQPPIPAALDAAFAPLVPAFFVDGPGPLFLQDFETLEADLEPVERLLIEVPGESTLRKNTDLLVKRGAAQQLSRATAAMALFTLQAWAPAGGAGNRTGLRGGGPLITLVRPAQTTLWHLLWANTPTGKAPSVADLPRVLPWLAPSLTSEGARVVVPEVDAHPLQAFWGMPRRIRLAVEALPNSTPCDLTGAVDDHRVIGWRQRPRGANYAAWGKVHPLSPYYQPKVGGEWLPVHPQPGGIGYRHWLGLVVAEEQRIPAASISTWRDARAEDAGEGRHPTLLAAGYDMDNMKARAFIEAEMPLPGDATQRKRLDRLSADLVKAADNVASLLRRAARHALFSSGASVKLDWEALASLRERLWTETEADFFACLSAATVTGLTTGEEPQRSKWLALLRRSALALFDEAAPLTPETSAAAPRIAQARRGLSFALNGFGKDGQILFITLQLALPKEKTA